jgi:hypothetical protein
MSNLMHVAHESPWRCSSHFWPCCVSTSTVINTIFEYTLCVVCDTSFGRKKDDISTVSKHMPMANVMTTHQQPPVLVDAVRGRLRACRAGVPRELRSDLKPSSEPVDSAIARLADETGESEEEDLEAGEVGVVVRAGVYSDMARGQSYIKLYLNNGVGDDTYDSADAVACRLLWMGSEQARRASR